MSDNYKILVWQSFSINEIFLKHSVRLVIYWNWNRDSMLRGIMSITANWFLFCHTIGSRTPVQSWKLICFSLIFLKGVDMLGHMHAGLHQIQYRLPLLMFLWKNEFPAYILLMMTMKQKRYRSLCLLFQEVPPASLWNNKNKPWTFCLRYEYCCSMPLNVSTKLFESVPRFANHITLWLAFSGAIYGNGCFSSSGRDQIIPPFFVNSHSSFSMFHPGAHRIKSGGIDCLKDRMTTFPSNCWIITQSTHISSVSPNIHQLRNLGLLFT